MSVEKDPNGNKFIPYMREDRLPHIFCPGCGNYECFFQRNGRS